MISLRFYREAPQTAYDMGDLSLDAYLDAFGYGTAFRVDHLYPMAAAIWSTPAAEIGEYPARAFIRFCENHGLLQLVNRPLWRTLAGGSRAYVEKLAATIPEILTDTPVLAVRRHLDGVEIVSRWRTRRGALIRSSWRHTPIRRSRCWPTRRRGRAAAGRFWLLREQRRAPFRRNPDAAPTPRVVQLELYVERPGEQQETGGQLLDKSPSRRCQTRGRCF